MAQHDYVIDNQTAPNFRADLNNALLAIASNNSGPTAPSTTYANMMWYDSNSNILKMRNEADDAWIDIGTLNQSTDQFEVANLTTLLQSDWEAGTSTTEAIVSPAKVKAAISALVSAETSAVLSATAGASVGSVGSYAFLARNGGGTISIGSTYAGSGLRYTGLVSGSSTSDAFAGGHNGTPAGTWRAMSGTRTDGNTMTLFLRIS